MPRDTLATLIKVRQSACDDAMRSLVQALDLESQALQAAHAIERAIAQETEIASDPASSDEVVEAFGKWLHGARRQLDVARIVLQERQAEATRKRAELTACRAALESVETLQAERHRVGDDQTERRADDADH